MKEFLYTGITVGQLATHPFLAFMVFFSGRKKEAGQMLAFWFLFLLMAMAARQYEESRETGLEEVD